MTAIEVLIALAIFTILLMVLTSLQSQFLTFERETDLQLFDHPQRLAVVERMRSDVHDAISYPSIYKQWTQNQSTLILRRSESVVIVWSFAEDEAERRIWVDDLPETRWMARGVPRFEIAAAHGAPGKTGVRLRGFDDDERLIFDQIMFPRAE